MAKDLSPEAELLLLIMASHGGVLSKAKAEAEFRRVQALPPELWRVWLADAQAKARTYARLRRQVDE